MNRKQHTTQISFVRDTIKHTINNLILPLPQLGTKKLRRYRTSVCYQSKNRFLNRKAASKIVYWVAIFSSWYLLHSYKP